MCMHVRHVGDGLVAMAASLMVAFVVTTEGDYGVSGKNSHQLLKPQAQVQMGS